MENKLEVLNSFTAFLQAQPHLKQDFIDAVAISARRIIHHSEGYFEQCSAEDGVITLLEKQDKFTKKVIFNL